MSPKKEKLKKKVLIIVNELIKLASGSVLFLLAHTAGYEQIMDLLQTDNFSQAKARFPIIDVICPAYERLPGYIDQYLFK